MDVKLRIFKAVANEKRMRLIKLLPVPLFQNSEMVI